MINNEYAYVYKRGNLIKIYENKKLINKYYYDESNRIIREDNLGLKSTITYKYNNENQLTERKVFNYTTKAKLKNAKNTENNVYYKNKIILHNDEKFKYSSNGEINLFRDAELKWNDNKLSDIDVNYHFEYQNNLRTSKIASGELTKYFYENNKLTKQENDVTLKFIYNSNEITGFEILDNFNCKHFNYIKNQNNDIIAIVNDKNIVICKYSYDILGNHETTLIFKNDYYEYVAEINPFRFHCYYFDIETGLYYINGKYYDSQIGLYIK